MMCAPSPSIPGTHIVSQLLLTPVVAVLDCARRSISVGGRPCRGGTFDLFDFVVELFGAFGSWTGFGDEPDGESEFEDGKSDGGVICGCRLGDASPPCKAVSTNG